MKVNIYANYGVLAHEKETVYTTAPHEHATVSELVTIELPDDLLPYRTIAGAYVVLLGNVKHFLSETLSNIGDKPALKWFDGTEHHTMPLHVLDADTHLKPYYILRDMDGYGSEYPICVDRDEAERLVREWDKEDFGEVWREATEYEIATYGRYDTEED